LADVSVTFTGRLDHDALAPLLPGFDVLVAPSILPEAFGMVAAEAAAAGVLPVLPGHSGIGEAGRRLEDELALQGRLVFNPRDPALDMARRIDDLLSIPTKERRDLGLAAAALAREVWSWEHVAGALLDAAV
jgi:glycosyltransferase involved in cell wall biosynthesis